MPSTSIISKCVPASHLGKLLSVTQSVSMLVGTVLMYLKTEVSKYYRASMSNQRFVITEKAPN